MAQTETHEHALTQKALDTLAAWGNNPNTDGGENIIFSVSRQGAPSDAFLWRRETAHLSRPPHLVAF
jgi:hypothetical protein